MAPNRGIPDMAHINRKLPIADIARALDLRFASATMLHCWRPERHQHGDRTASASILTSSNKIKCFVCNFRPKGPIDFAMDVLEMSSPADAALWIAARFPVPLIPARKHLAGTARRGERVQSGLALMIRSGLWAQLSPAAKAIAPALLEMAEKESGASERMTVELSYVGITRMSGITSPNAIHRALCALGEIGLMLPPDGRTPGKLVQETARYTMTPYSQELLDMAQATAQQARDEIAAGVELRARLRKERVHTYAGKQQGKEPQQ
jgi:hypothetical protein